MADAVGHSLPALRQAGLSTAGGYDAYVRLFAGRQSLWTQPFGGSAASPVFARRQGRLALGRKSNPIRKSFSSRVCSTTPRCGRLAFTTLPARWKPSSMRASSGNLCDGSRTVYLAFDADSNGSAPRASDCLSRSLRERGISTSSGVPARGPRSQQLLRATGSL